MRRPIFFTADHHWGHAAIIHHDARPFSDLDEMWAGMIDRWNAVVPVGAEVYHLGDLTMQGWMYAEAVLHRLNGHVYLVPGNHDKRWVKEAQRMVDVPGVTILPPIHTLKLQGLTNIVLCHYPMLSWNQSGYGVWHLHGHSHGRLRGNLILYHPRRIDVGVNCWNYAPVSLEEITEKVNANQSMDLAKREEGGMRAD